MLRSAHSLRSPPLIAFAALVLADAASAQTPPDILLYKGPDREQRLIEGARKEGQVVIYGALIQNQAMRPIAGNESVASIAIGTPARSAAAQSQSSVPSSNQPRSGSCKNP